MIVQLNKKEYHVNENEFNLIEHKEYFNLSIRDDLSFCEKIASLLTEIFEMGVDTLLYCNPTHGGFIPIQVSTYFKNIFLTNIDNIHNENIVKNIEKLKIKNIYQDFSILGDDCVIFSNVVKYIDLNFVEKYNPIILTESNIDLTNIYKYNYPVKNTNYVFYIPEIKNDLFCEQFKFYIHDGLLIYDNLINLCIMVKNGGELFEQMLRKNIDIFDRWTILDTGSTDGTIEVIKKLLVGKKNGVLYEEPFINFRESRNRCLDLAGTKCKYNLMLDDTYVIEGDLRSFLNEIRGDQFGDSYSLTIKSHDVEYISNRITKSENHLRYIYTMHEVIEDKNNRNVRVPENRAFVTDFTNNYMLNRSDTRKEYDLKCLYEMLEEYPDEPRNLYYLGQTYKMLGNFEKASEYYHKRAFFYIDGFDQEKFDALFEFTRINIYQLNKPWREYEKYYELCIKWQPSRPEGNYFLGIHYFVEGDHATAFYHFKRAFEIGFPYHQQYSLKPTINYVFTPYYLSSLCYEFKDFKLGLDATTLYLHHNNSHEQYYQLMLDWHKIYEMLVRMPAIQPLPKVFEKPIFCIVADGGFTKWSGKNIMTTGVGGSETWVIEMARYINQLSDFEVIVFCNCEEDDIFEGVKYLRLSRYLQTISEINVSHCMISRFSEYIPASIEGHVENIHLILHDLQLSGNIIPIHHKIKNIFCLTEWHKHHFLETFPQFTERTHSLHYGIDFTKFLNNKTQEKVPYSFIYSSFPNRGVIVVLKMWPQIVTRYPEAVLNIFTDIDNKWANDFYPDEMIEIKNILELYKNLYPTSVFNHGWVDKSTLADFWKKSAVWFYPCKFQETFCLTALEAALTKTLAIANDLAALQDTIGDRGIIIPGDATTDEWQNAAFEKICEVLDNLDTKKELKKLIERNYQWALKHSWKNRASYLLNNFISSSSSNPWIELEQDKETLKSIDKIYYINLSKREDRNKHFLEEMRKQNVPKEKIQRFEAVNGLEYYFLKKEESLFKNVNYLYMPTKLQIMGNQLSHFKIFQEMIERNYKYVIVCQDDVVLKDNFTSYIDRLMCNIPEDTEILHFGFHKYAVRDVFLPWDLSQEGDDISYSVVNQMVGRLAPDFNAVYNSNNTTGYILTLKGAKNYVEYILENGFKYATDCDINEYLIRKNIYYGSRVVLATTLPNFGSDVFENMWNSHTNDSHISNPHKLTINNIFLNYLDMYNWTNDLPANTNAKLTFVAILANFIRLPSCEILEIGTFAGTSVIGMLQYLPNANATTIDPWTNYEEKECGTNLNAECLKNMEENNVENVFRENVLKAGFNTKVNAIKGSSELVLIDLIKQNKQYDFIYVDGSHKAIDCYTDCWLSWQLLNENGIMGIDDYLYNISLTDEFENVRKGVDHFLEKIKGQHVLLVNGYRLFIKKVKKVKTIFSATEFLEKKYNLLSNTHSDINEHLPTLYKYACECESVIELGVRGCVSTWAFLKGLHDNGKDGKHLFLNDIEHCPIDELLNVSRNLKINVEYEWINDLELNVNNKMFDITFIDTWHIYGQLKRELAKFSVITNKYIIMHDTTVDGKRGETIRLGFNASQQSLESGFPVEEIECGLQKAINEFLFVNREWRIKEVFENNNGLTVLERVFVH